MKTYCSVHGLVEHQGEYLVLQRAKDRTDPKSWNCVTGHIKEKESAEDAVLREVREETNLKNLTLVQTTKPFWIDVRDKRWIIVASLLKCDDISDLQIDESESMNYKWIKENDKIVNESFALRNTMKKLEII
jgi:ADP-ribose pyrophosphatase YjhB (NUDIX family)